MSSRIQVARTGPGLARVVTVVLWVGIAVCRLGAAADAQESNGRIDGRLIRNDGTGVGAATVVLNETGATEFTSPSGQFFFSNLPPGSYSITFTLGEHVVTLQGVRVTSATTTALEETVDWTVGFTETLIVRGRFAASGANRRSAPAAATVVAEAEIERKASHGQLPKLLEFTPGAQVTPGRALGLQHGDARVQSRAEPPCRRAPRRSRSLSSLLRLSGMAGLFISTRRSVQRRARARAERRAVWRQRVRWRHHA